MPSRVVADAAIVGRPRQRWAGTHERRSLSPTRSRGLSQYPSGVILIFAGFRSRWTIPRSCAASSASAICRAIASASGTGRPSTLASPRASLSARVTPSTSSNTNARNPVRLLDAVDRTDVRMIEGREQAGFTLEPGETIGIRRKRRRQDLDRDVPSQLRVPRAIHLPHAAFANPRRDHVRPELLTDPDPPGPTVRHSRILRKAAPPSCASSDSTSST